jgi:hypothetical protein
MTTAFNPMFDISEMAIDFAEETIENYNTSTRAVVLFAQMQSGKTDAFLLLAGEMLFTRQVENVVIFTGNREIELKNQLTTQIKGSSELSFFDTKFNDYVIRKISKKNNGIINYEDILNTRKNIQEIKNKITIIWGTELTKKIYKTPTQNTLYIYEESHFAQSVGQTPEKFLKNIGIPANGDFNILEKKNNYICSVSATPFSEICDSTNLNQDKKIIRLKPGDSYRGIKWLRDNGKIIGYDDWESALSNALYLTKNEEKWSILRVRGNEQLEKAVKICEEAEWVVYKYDQEFSDIKNMKELANKPNKASIVILREKCRMGTVVPKNHLAFVFETSNSSNTDTALQGLLGRSCGYHTNDTLLVYVNNSILESNEINKYIDFCEGENNCLPVKAKNIIKSNEDTSNEGTYKRGESKKMSQIIPIYIPASCFTINECLQKKNIKHEAIPDIINALLYNDIVKQHNYNPDSVNKLVIELLENNIKVEMHNLSYKTYKNIPNKLAKAIKFRRPPILVSGGGCSINGGCTLYYVDKPIIDKPILNYEFEVGSFYICCYLNMTDEQIAEIETKRIKKLPQTNGKEIFRYTNVLETGEICIANGGYCLNLNPESSTNVNIMLNTLRECVLRSKETETMLINPRKITSICQPGYEKYIGIYVSLEVYIALLYGGIIYNEIKKEFDVTIKFINNKGRQPNDMPNNCIYRLAEIYW